MALLGIGIFSVLGVVEEEWEEERDDPGRVNGTSSY